MESTSVVTFPNLFWSTFWVDMTDAPTTITEYGTFESTTNISTTLRPANPTESLPPNKRIDTLALVILPLVMLCGLIGNALVCIVVFRFTALRVVANYFIVSLAVADLAVCALVMPLAAYQELSGSWGLGKVMCDIWVTLDILMSTASIWNLCVISLDRYMAITRPVWYALRRTPVMASVAITVAWVLSVLVSIPALIFVGGNDGASADNELCVLNITPAFAIVSSLVSFYVPCIIVLILYQRILVAARHHSRRRVRPAIASLSNAPPATVKNTSRDNNASSMASSSGNQSQGAASNANNNASTESIDGQTSDIDKTNMQENANDELANEGATESLGNQTPDRPDHAGNIPMGATKANTNNANGASVRASVPKQVTIAAVSGNAVGTTFTDNRSSNHRMFVRRRQISVTRERRAAFVLAIVVGVFICCWLPFFIINVFLGICPTCNISLVAFQVVTWLGWCNSIINPIIYTTFNREFRNAFKKTLFCGKL